MSLQVDATLEILDISSSSSSPVSASQLQLRLNYQTPQVKRSPVYLLLVADVSGSMSGNPWNQVKGALNYMLKSSFEEDSNINTDIIVYNSTAKLLTYNAENYENTINWVRASGTTNFSAAYDQICVTLKSKKLTKNHETVIVFLTDGEDTSKIDPQRSLKNLKNTISSMPCPVVVHSVGFSKDHQFNMLNELRMLGKEKGVYQYAEPSDGPAALTAKLQGIFNYVSVSGSKVVIQMEVEGYSFTGGLAKELISKKDAIVRLEKDGTLQLTYSMEQTNTKGNLSSPMVTVKLLDRDNEFVASSPAVIKEITGSVASTSFKLRLMDQSLQEIVEILGNGASLPTEAQRAKCLGVMKTIQQDLQEFSGPSVFRLPQDQREQVLFQVQAIHSRLNQLFEALAALARGQWTNVNRARLADIAYSNVFTKANRQRRMDSRVTSNAERQKEDSAKLDALQLNNETLASVGEESTNLFYCVLSLSNWVELAQNKDVCGFGLAVLRPEWVVDDPTQIRIANISTTFCAKSAIEDSIKYSIDVQGQIATTGGFGIGQEVGVATTGSGREPINAWLPLYIHPQHWEIIRINLRQILGYFVSLDPLGFAVDQVDSLFLVLGTMISRLTPTPGERQLQILLQFMRLCLAVAEEMNWFDRIEEKLVSTIERIHYDVTDQIKNLMVAVGYMAILPQKRIQKIFKTPSHMTSFWTAVMAISARRSAFTMFNDLTELHVRLFLDQLLYGNANRNYKPAGDGNVGAAITTMFDLSSFEDLSSLIAFEKSFDPSTITPNIEAAVSQFGVAMNRYGYPTATSLYSSLVFFLSWNDLVAKSTDQNPAASLLVQLDKTDGVPTEAWIEALKTSFDSIYTQRPPTLVSYFELLQERFGLPHPLMQVARAVVAQGVQYRVNKPAKEAFDRGVYMNTLEDPNNCFMTLHYSLIQQRKHAFSSLAAAQKFQSMTSTAIARADVLMFVSEIQVILNSTRKEVGFKLVHTSLQTNSARITIPFAEAKLRVLITGKYTIKNDDGTVSEANALDNGAVWIPGRVYMKRLAEIYGHNTMEAIVTFAIQNSPRVWSM